MTCTICWELHPSLTYLTICRLHIHTHTLAYTFTPAHTHQSLSVPLTNQLDRVNNTPPHPLPTSTWGRRRTLHEADVVLRGTAVIKRVANSVVVGTVSCLWLTSSFAFRPTEPWMTIAACRTPQTQEETNYYQHKTLSGDQVWGTWYCYCCWYC